MFVLRFYPCHKYGYCILLFFLGEFSSDGDVMPFVKASSATAAGGVLGEEHWMASHCGVCLPSFGITAGASRLAMKSSACRRMVGKPFSAMYSLSFLVRWNRLRKSDLASLANRSVKSYSWPTEVPFRFLPLLGISLVVCIFVVWP